jgi:hypothetical protein
VQRAGQEVQEGTTKLYPDKKPRAMDITATIGANKGKVFLSIYKVDGDTYLSCVAQAGKDRPTEFSSKPGTDHYLFRWQRSKPAEPISKEIAQAWKKAGAEVGWMRLDDSVFLPDKEGMSGDLPAFRFSTLKEGVLAKLPDPAAPFGLELADNKLEDAGLKGLAGLKSLQALSLDGTKVTGAGLKELAGLKLKALGLPESAMTDLGLEHYLAAVEPPTSFNLFGWQVTDAGLKALSGLKNLQYLDLRITKVTDAGLKHLAGLKNLQR